MDYIQQPGIVPQEPQDSHSTFTPAYQETADPNLIAYQLNIDDILKIVKLELKQKGAPEELVKEILSILGPIAGNRSIYLSNFDEQDIDTTSFDANQAIIHVVFEFGDGLKDSQKDGIIAMCYTVIRAALKRPFNQGERKFLSKTVERREIFQKEPEKKISPMRRFIKW